MVEHVIRTLKERSVHRHRSESRVHATRVSAGWITLHNQQRSHQVPKLMTPDATYAVTLTA
ncbi:hypothetical protein [Stenotrophomonas maltophilia]|uniref:hypothetical protein n=1 Tax=Stenotrophomonas maltophilia TaxID=40324 RepID=UPI003D18FBFF